MDQNSTKYKRIPVKGTKLRKKGTHLQIGEKEGGGVDEGSAPYPDNASDIKADDQPFVGFKMLAAAVTLLYSEWCNLFIYVFKDHLFILFAPLFSLPNF